MMSDSSLRSDSPLPYRRPPQNSSFRNRIRKDLDHVITLRSHYRGFHENKWYKFYLTRSEFMRFISTGQRLIQDELKSSILQEDRYLDEPHEMIRIMLRTSTIPYCAGLASGAFACEAETFELMEFVVVVTLTTLRRGRFMATAATLGLLSRFAATAVTDLSRTLMLRRP